VTSHPAEHTHPSFSASPLSGITTSPHGHKVLHRVSCLSILLKSCKSISTLEGAAASLSVTIRLLAEVLTELLNTIHNHLLIAHLTTKHASPPPQSTPLGFLS
jgi:hypothetical protein